MITITTTLTFTTTTISIPIYQNHNQNQNQNQNNKQHNNDHTTSSSSSWWNTFTTAWFNTATKPFKQGQTTQQSHTSSSSSSLSSFGKYETGSGATCALSTCYPYPSSSSSLSSSSSSSSSSIRCSLPSSHTCFDQSEVQEYEYLHLYQHIQTQTQTHRQQQAAGPSIETYPFSIIEPPSAPFDGNCAITFRNVVLHNGNHLIVYGNDSYIDQQLSTHSNVAILHNRIAMSNIGNPFSNRYSIQMTRDTKHSYAEQKQQCTTHYTHPVFFVSARDHTLGNYYHFHAELWAHTFWTMANPMVNGIRPIGQHAPRVPGATLSWTSSNSTVFRQAGSIAYEKFAVLLQDLTEQEIQPVLEGDRNKHTGTECFSQLTVGLESTISLYSLPHIRRQVQPLLDWVDFRYNISVGLTARKHGWNVFRSSLVSSASTPDPRPHVVFSVRKMGGRYLHNETLIVSLLERHGFRVSTILFTNYPIKQTIELLRTAHVYLAVHGAGLANSLYLHAGAVMVQLMNPTHPVQKPIYPRIAMNVGAEYVEFAISENKDATVQIQDWAGFEAVLRSVSSLVSRLLLPTATWSPTRPQYFKWPTQQLPISHCGHPATNYD